jgi:hypothetical protein
MPHSAATCAIGLGLTNTNSRRRIRLATAATPAPCPFSFLGLLAVLAYCVEADSRNRCLPPLDVRWHTPQPMMPFAFNSLSGDQRKEIAQVVSRVNRRWPVRSERFCRSKETAPARGATEAVLDYAGGGPTRF